MRAPAKVAVGLAAALAAAVLFRIVVVGGQPAPDRPWIVQVSKQGEVDCSGTIVGRRTVLTAAHCFETAQTAGVTIEIENHGAITADCRRQSGYVRLPQLDVGICELSSDSPVRPRRLLVASGPLAKQPVTFFGFGCFSLTYPYLGGTRRRGEGRATSAGGVLEVAGHRACSGDSGGPVFLGDENGPIIGVVSDGNMLAPMVAWTITAPETQRWFRDAFKGKICFDGEAGAACKPDN